MNDLLYCISVTDFSDAPGAGAEFLSAMDYDMSSWKDEETKVIKHSIYFQSEPDAFEALEFLKKESVLWKDFGIVLDDFVYSTLKKEDWAESWKIHFKPMEISDRLAIKPSWETWDAKPGQVVLELDPGMSFGTGQHATTKFCLIALDRFIQESYRPLSMLDAGAGSGILAIAAYSLGCRPVAAFDIDPETIPVARENAQKNMVPDSELKMETASLEGYCNEICYDIVAANILSSALLAGRDKLLSMVVPGGKLILAGILDSEYAKIKSAFEEARCTELFSIQEKEWRGGAFNVN